MRRLRAVPKRHLREHGRGRTWWRRLVRGLSPMTPASKGRRSGRVEIHRPPAYHGGPHGPAWEAWKAENRAQAEARARSDAVLIRDAVQAATTPATSGRVFDAYNTIRAGRGMPTVTYVPFWEALKKAHQLGLIVKGPPIRGNSPTWTVAASLSP